MKRDELYVELLDRASDEEIGLVVETSNARRLAAKLYELVKLDRYKNLMICTPSIPDHIFITQRTVELDEYVAQDT